MDGTTGALLLTAGRVPVKRSSLALDRRLALRVYSGLVVVEVHIRHSRGEVRFATVMGSLLVGLALLYLHSFIKPELFLSPRGDEARLGKSGTQWF